MASIFIYVRLRPWSLNLGQPAANWFVPKIVKKIIKASQISNIFLKLFHFPYVILYMFYLINFKILIYLYKR